MVSIWCTRAISSCRCSLSITLWEPLFPVGPVVPNFLEYHP
jgi:hypothetical protein